MSTVCPIYRKARLQPWVCALEWETGQLDYEALDFAISEARERLVAAGITARDRVAIVLENSWKYVILLQAVFRLKAVAVPLSTRFPEEILDRLIGEMGCRAVIRSGEPGRSTASTIELDDIVSEPISGTGPDEPRIDLHQEATILFSSGSTGLPKAILHSWGNHYFNALGSNKNIVVRPADRWLLSLPLFHVAGLAVLFRCFLAGATVVLPAKDRSIFGALKDRKITHVSLVSTQLLRLLDASRGMTLPGLKGILLGGSAISRALIARAYEAGWPIHTSYGMTEMASQVATTRPNASMEELCTAGWVLDHRAMRFDREGQIWVRGATRFVGAVVGHATGTKTIYPFDEDGWYATGDLGRQDDKGRLVVLGRKDNMFISGGENVHPEEIERALEQHVSIERAVVVPVRDPEFGFRPVAFLERGAAKLDETMIGDHLSGRIAGFMKPIAYFELPDLAVEQGIKVSRKELQKRAEALLG